MKKILLSDNSPFFYFSAANLIIQLHPFVTRPYKARYSMADANLKAISNLFLI